MYSAVFNASEKFIWNTLRDEVAKSQMNCVRLWQNNFKCFSANIANSIGQKKLKKIK